MKVAITDEHLNAWSANPPEKRLVISDASIVGLQAWREPSGVIAWRLRYISPITRKRQTLTLGRWPVVRLTDARIKALELSDAVQKGRDPKLEGEGVVSELTLGQLLSQMTEAEGALFHRTKGAQGLAPRTAQDYKRYRENHYGPLADLPVDYLQRHPHVILSHIAGIRSRGSESNARLVKASMSSAFAWGIESGLIPIQINPCLAQYRARRKKSSTGTIMRFLSTDELKRLLIGLDDEATGKTVRIKRGQAAVRAMTLLMLYTGCRPGEAAGAFRDEFDLDAGTWTLPGFRAYQWNGADCVRRTKNGKKHILPLPTQAVQLVADTIEAGGFSPWLFPVRRFAGAPKVPHMQTPKTMLERIFNGTHGENITPHSLRRSVATHLEEQGFAEKLMVGKILNHTPQDVTSKHYLGGSGLKQIREVLQGWADYLDRLKKGLENKVVGIGQLKRRVAG